MFVFCKVNVLLFSSLLNMIIGSVVGGSVVGGSVGQWVSGQGSVGRWSVDLIKPISRRSVGFWWNIS